MRGAGIGDLLLCPVGQRLDVGLAPCCVGAPGAGLLAGRVLSAGTVAALLSAVACLLAGTGGAFRGPSRWSISAPIPSSSSPVAYCIAHASSSSVTSESPSNCPPGNRRASRSRWAASAAIRASVPGSAPRARAATSWSDRPTRAGITPGRRPGRRTRPVPARHQPVGWSKITAAQTLYCGT
ncbi:hypothetical protein OHA61_38390 [Streptomyces sp. NBC_00885]|uniref:hypothetical protein n=1 Tax=Streptomyces sp. NBC_00885 TaxID=2975857 RepID=UPI00386BB30E|nr:hypothetical protein OHA61_38390 [Streptomyces sp. NBC_00885]